MTPRLITRRGLLAGGERLGPTEPTGETVGSNPSHLSIRAVRIGVPPALAHPRNQKSPETLGFPGISFCIFPSLTHFMAHIRTRSGVLGFCDSRIAKLREKRQGAFSYCRKFYPNRLLSKFYFENDRLLAHKSALYVKSRLVPAPYRPFIASQY